MDSNLPILLNMHIFTLLTKYPYSSNKIDNENDGYSMYVHILFAIRAYLHIYVCIYVYMYILMQPEIYTFDLHVSF